MSNEKTPQLIKVTRSRKTKRQRNLRDRGFFYYAGRTPWGNKLYKWRWVSKFGVKKYKLNRQRI